MSQDDLEAERIRANTCPKCGNRVKDKGSFIRCVSCSWALTHGVYNSEEGYVIDYSGRKHETERD